MKTNKTNRSFKTMNKGNPVLACFNSFLHFRGATELQKLMSSEPRKKKQNQKRQRTGGKIQRSEFQERNKLTRTNKSKR
jgi:hypothetical protein